MGRLGWPLGLVLTFALGAAAGGLSRGVHATAPEVERLQDVVQRQELELGALKARLREREGAQPGRTAAASTARRIEDAWQHSAAAADAGGPVRPGRSGPADGLSHGATPADLASPIHAGRASAGAAATVETALERFYRFIEDTSGAAPRRWQRTRELAADLRAMGDAGTEALMRVLANGTSSDERRTAAQLLGELQAARALPLLQGILEQDNDVLLRRAAASALRRLETPDVIPVLQGLLGNPNEDRFVRMSAALGLARLGNAQGVTGLVMIFDETTGDGRGRDGAFRALVSLNDERALPFMRQLVASGAELSYRLRAIQFLEAQGDRQALTALQVVMQTPTEQPSIRDAATQAYASIAAR